MHATHLKNGEWTMACISVPNIFCSWVGIAGALLLLSKNIVRIAEKKRFSKKYG